MLLPDVCKLELQGRSTGRGSEEVDLYLKTNYLFYYLKNTCICTFSVICAHTSASAHGVQTMASDPLELKLSAVLSRELNSGHLQEQ